MTAQIRHAIESDMSEVMDLLRRKAEFDGCPEAFRATVEALKQAWFSEPRRASALVAEVDGRLVGLATYFPTYSTFLARPGLWLDDLFVAASHRNRGIGRALMSRLARIAEELGCGRIEWTVASGNDRGIAFYEREGAAIHQNTRPVRLSREGIERLARSDRVPQIQEEPR
jgi:GNAT superfamily N-acetyltransferase